MPEINENENQQESNTTTITILKTTRDRLKQFKMHSSAKPKQEKFDTLLNRLMDISQRHNNN